MHPRMYTQLALQLSLQNLYMLSTTVMEHGRDGIQESCLPLPQGVGSRRPRGLLALITLLSRNEARAAERRQSPLSPASLRLTWSPLDGVHFKEHEVPSRGWSESQLSKRNNSFLLWASATALFSDAKWFSSSPRVNICLMQSFLSQFRPPCKCRLEVLPLLRAGPMRWDCNKMCSDTKGSFRPRTCMKQKWPPRAGSWWTA